MDILNYNQMPQAQWCLTIAPVKIKGRCARLEHTLNKDQRRLLSLVFYCFLLFTGQSALHLLHIHKKQ